MADGAKREVPRIDWMSFGEVAEVLGVAEPTVRNWERRGEMPRAIRIAGTARFNRADIEQWLTERIADAKGAA